MNFFKRGALIAGLMGVAGAAQAQFSSTVTATSDYDFRGVSQSAKDPAIQASLDYAFPQGFAIGAWASNVDFGDGSDADIELDFYGSYTGKINDTTNWTAGLVYYGYPSSDDAGEFVEIYAGLDVGPFSVRQWFTDNQYDLDQNAQYTEANYTFELPQGVSLQLHGGYSWGDFWEDAGGEIFDYSVGLGYTYRNLSLNLKYTGTDASGAQKVTTDANNTEGRVIFTVATTLPWGE